VKVEPLQGPNTPPSADITLHLDGKPFTI